jgi:hypothetical protein
MTIHHLLRMAEPASIQETARLLFMLSSFSTAAGEAEIAARAIGDAIDLVEHAARLEANRARGS